MNAALDAAVLLQKPLGVHQIVPAAIHREAGEFPLDNAREPDERADVKEFDWAEALLCFENFKTRVRKLLTCDLKVLFRERKLCLPQKQLRQNAICRSDTWMVCISCGVASCIPSRKARVMCSVSLFSLLIGDAQLSIEKQTKVGRAGSAPPNGQS